MSYSYPARVALGLDQFVNTLFNGWPDETLSARAYRQRQRWFWRWLYRALDFCFHKHCERALASEISHLQSPPDER